MAASSFILSILGVLICHFSLSHGYDSLDPRGNVTIKWDILQAKGSSFDVRVSIFNFQAYRHVEAPGWRLRWDWIGDEVIWNMWGAEATLQGKCSDRFSGELPHTCEKSPVIVDLLPGTPYNQQVANCCKGGVLSSFIQDPSNSAAVFQMNMEASSPSEDTTSKFTMPQNFSLGLNGYTCGVAQQVAPTMFSSDGGRRWTQAVGTWNIICIYSQFRASPNPKCCVSLSAFYNNTIVPCPNCSCNCKGLPGAKCHSEENAGSMLQMPHDPLQEPEDLVRCTDHMCPIRVHWHVKQNYKAYWRVKITVTNLNMVRNYSDWSLVVQHPNLQSVQQIFSFNFQPLKIHGFLNDTGMFWGVRYYNEILMQSGVDGNVQTEMLLSKNTSLFTLHEGWAFPRKISFNGDHCVMPPPDDYPRVPNSSTASKLSLPVLVFISLLPIIIFIGPSHFLDYL